MRTYEMAGQIASYKNEFSASMGCEFVAILARGFKTILVGNEYSLENKILSESFKNLKKIFNNQYKGNTADSVQHLQFNAGNSTIFIVHIDSSKVPAYLYAVVDNRVSSEEALARLYTAISTFLNEEMVCGFLLESVFGSKGFPEIGNNRLETEDELPPFMRTDSVLRMLALRES